MDTTLQLAEPPFDIPTGDEPEFAAAVPYEERQLVRMKLAAFRSMWNARGNPPGPGLVATARLQAASLACYSGCSAKRLIALYYAYLRTRDWRVVINGCKAPNLIGTESGLPSEFRAFVRDFLGLNQRQKMKPRYRALLRRLDQWRVTGHPQFAIPGYAFPPADAPGQRHPLGWSFANLCRLKPSRFERAALAIGRQAARAFLPPVYTTRCGLKVGEIFCMDDQVHDLRVNFLGNKKAQRPLEFACLDVFSACFVAHGFKPTTTLEDESRVMLRQEDFVWFALHWLLNIGWRDDTGTRVMAEHGTAKFPDWLVEGIARLTRDKVTVIAGAVDRRAAFPGLFDGPARGNFKIKAALESAFNLVRNETADMELLPGQVGKDRLHAPEEWEQRVAHNERLLQARDEIAARHGDTLAGQLRFDYLEWHQFIALALTLYDRIDRRTEHALEGWLEAGLVVPDPALGRPRRLSPSEVWRGGRAELRRAPGYWIPLLLPPEMGTEREVSERHLIEFEDQQIGPGPLRYLAQIADRPLAPGAKYLTYVNPWSPTELYLTDAQGCFVGSCPRWTAPCKSDLKAIADRVQTARTIEARLLRPVARAGAALSRRAAEDAEHNARVLDQATDGLTPAQRQAEAAERADLEALAEAGLERMAGGR